MIRSVVELVANESRVSPRPWLLVGKGPTSDHAHKLDPARYHVLTLNHAFRLVPPTVAHFTDLATYRACAAEVAGLPVCLPWHPHVSYRASPLSLADHATRVPALAALEAAGLLLSYNSTTAGRLPRNPELPTLRVRFFSAVAAFNLLAAAGVRDVHTLGIDGGTGYGRAFDTGNRLANGRATFDDQRAEIVRTTARNKMRWTRLEF